jgi:hypothetical protein
MCMCFWVGSHVYYVSVHACLCVSGSDRTSPGGAYYVSVHACVCVYVLLGQITHVTGRRLLCERACVCMCVCVAGSDHTRHWAALIM